MMRAYPGITRTGVVLTMLLCVSPAFARDHGALSGVWTLVPAKSDFAGQSVVQTGTVTIKDEKGIIIVSRRFVYEGAHETFFYSDDIGTENKATVHTGKDLKTKAQWDHDVLRVTTTLAGAVTVESYSLADDGVMTVNVARPDRKAITLVFHRE